MLCAVWTWFYFLEKYDMHWGREFGQDQREDSKENPRMIAKPTITVPSLSQY